MAKSLSTPLILAALAVGQPAQAAGDLLVAPTRIILDGARGTEVILNNIGTQPATYRISLELRRMTATGQVDEVSEANANATEKAALAMISYAPRRIVLPPNQPQAIRISVRPPAGLPDGEYRAHMLFRAIPDAIAPTVGAAPPRGLSVALIPIYGVTIPIIVRKGALKAAAAITDVHGCELDRRGDIAPVRSAMTSRAVCFTLARSGDRSTYGRIRVTRAGLATPLVDTRGIAVYTEIASRKVALPVLPALAAQASGPIKVEYLEDSDTATGSLAVAQGVLR